MLDKLRKINTDRSLTMIILDIYQAAAKSLDLQVNE